jgi:hypothetical protein
MTKEYVDVGRLSFLGAQASACRGNPLLSSPLSTTVVAVHLLAG